MKLADLLNSEQAVKSSLLKLVDKYMLQWMRTQIWARIPIHTNLTFELEFNMHCVAVAGLGQTGHKCRSP